MQVDWRPAYTALGTIGRSQPPRRMELARRLLETTDLDVTTICHRIGYASLGSFSDAFHRAHGRPPSAWRRRSEALAVLREEVAPVPSCFLHRHASAQEVRNLGEAVQAVGP